MFLYSNSPDDRFTLDHAIVACAVDVKAVQAILVDEGDVSLTLPAGQVDVESGVDDLEVIDVLSVLGTYETESRSRITLEGFLKDLATSRGRR